MSPPSRCLSPGLIATRLLLSVSICSKECNWVSLIKYIAIVRWLHQRGRERVGPLHCSSLFSCHLHDLQLIFRAQPSNFANTMNHESLKVYCKTNTDLEVVFSKRTQLFWNNFRVLSRFSRWCTPEFSAGDDGGLVINTKQKKLEAKILFFKTKITSWHDS